jgi:hypothetical protein
VINLGNDNSGNIYQAHVNPETDLGVFVEKLASEKSLTRSMYYLNLVLTANLDKAKEFWKQHPERLEYLLKKYSKNAVETAIEKAKQENDSNA